jgi:DNA-directed RNA polymerase specialized sigma subunit
LNKLLFGAIEGIPTEPINTVDVIERSERLMAFAQAVKKLLVVDKQILAMMLYEKDLKQKDIAKRLDCTPAYISQRLTAMRKTFDYYVNKEVVAHA